MKKKITALAMALVMVLGVAAVAAGGDKTISVTPMNMTINGQAVTPLKSDGTPAEVFAYDGATYVPLRYLSETLGIKVEWDPTAPNTAKLVSDKITVPAAPAGVSFKAGTYTGEGKGFNGTIKVAVTLSDTKIEKVEVTEHSETPGIGTPAVEKIPAKIVEAQSTQVDAITSATFASNGIIEAVNAALKSAGVDPAALIPGAVNTNTNTPATKDADVVVVGAGGAGMTAAITAAKAGKKVVLLEKLALVGGNSTKSTGGMNAADTEYQDKYEFGQAAGLEKTLGSAAKDYPELKDLVAKVQKQYDDWKKAGSKGYFDTVDLMILDTMVGGKCVNDLKLVETLAKNSAAGVEWLKGIGANLDNVGAFGGASVNRIHWPKNDAGQKTNVGAYIVPIMEKACKDAGVEIVFEAPANEILMKDGKAVGVKTSTGLTVNAKSVIIATGGFGADLKMVAELKPSLDGFVTTNAPGATGDGIKMAQAVGAAVRDMDQIQIHPTVEQKTSALITEGLRGDGAILVNQEGKRFCDEVGTRDAVSAAELAQTGGYAYLIVDQNMVDASATIQGYIKKGFTVQGNTYAELGKAMGAPEAEMTKTMEAWNKCVADKKDAEFGRTNFANPLDKAPYYAIKIAPGIHHTMGGVVINTEAEVQTAAGASIPNLYAAGEVTGGVHGANRLGGNAVADIVVFGQIAGPNAAANAK